MEKIHKEYQKTRNSLNNIKGQKAALCSEKNLPAIQRSNNGE